MLQITPHQKLLLAVHPIDFRKGMDRLIAVCEQQLGIAPDDGSFFIFRNKKFTAVKIIIYDGQGYWLCMKRFSHGKLQWWPKNQDDVFNISAQQLQVLLYQGNPEAANIQPDWKPLTKFKQLAQ